MKPFENQKEVHVVYLGGSITEGFAASRPENNWVSLVGAHLEEMFPDKTFKHFNSGVGGTDSNYGLLRVVSDVIEHRPDLLFIEFAVNDSYDLTGILAAESILLTVNAAGLHPYVCFVCTAYRDLGGRPTAHEKYKRLGKRYGIPVIDFRESMAREQKAGHDTDRFFADGCHPSDEGHAFYAKELNDFLPTVFATPVPVFDGEPLDPKSRAMFCRFNPVLHSPDCKTTGTWIGRDGLLVTTEAGATLEGTFEGGVLGLVHYLNKNGGRFLFELDGAASGEINAFYPGVYQPVTCYCSFTLTPGTHHFKITALGTKSEESGGVEVVISAIVTETPRA